MPASPLPFIVSCLLIVIPLLCRPWGRKPFIRATAVSAALVLLLLLWIYVPGWILMVRVKFGNPGAMYDLALWTERHDEEIGQFMLWPFGSDKIGSYVWLEKAARLDYPPALYAFGWRLKYGVGVPRPVDWTGPGGNVFDQPERGQLFIDRALELGFKPSVPEREFFAEEYWKGSMLGAKKGEKSN